MMRFSWIRGVLILPLIFTLYACKDEKANSVCQVKTYRVIGLNINSSNFILEDANHVQFELRIPYKYLRDIPSEITVYEKVDYWGQTRRYAQLDDSSKCPPQSIR